MQKTEFEKFPPIPRRGIELPCQETGLYCHTADLHHKAIHRVYCSSYGKYLSSDGFSGRVICIQPIIA